MDDFEGFYNQEPQTHEELYEEAMGLLTRAQELLLQARKKHKEAVRKTK